MPNNNMQLVNMMSGRSFYTKLVVAKNAGVPITIDGSGKAVVGDVVVVKPTGKVFATELYVHEKLFAELAGLPHINGEKDVVAAVRKAIFKLFGVA